MAPMAVRLQLALVQRMVIDLNMDVEVIGALGVTVGSLAGFFRGRLDTLLMRATDLVITIPTIVVGR